MLTERLLMNDQVAKQRILGTIHAAPNGVTLTTLTWLTAEQGALRTSRIRELARGYARQHLIRIDDDVCYPTAKLTREVARWRVEKPRTQVRNNGRPGKATVEQRIMIVKAWRETSATLAEIAAAHGLHQSVVRRTIDRVVSPGEREVRRAERASVIRRERREAFMEAVRRRRETETAEVA